MSPTHVALLRGVNVGGGNRLLMADLRALAETLGWSDIATYIASGNLIFRAKGTPETLAAALANALSDRLDLNVPVLVLEADSLKASLDACPFGPDDPRHVHIYWMLAAPQFDDDLYNRLRAADEQLALVDRTAWLHAPAGFGRSRLGERLDRILGAPSTGRNLRTVRTIAAMLGCVST